MQKKLIINADDFGLSPAWNKGMLELADKNILTSISVMIKRKYVNVSELRKLKNISLGLHLEIDNRCSLLKIEKQILLFKKKLGKLPSHLDSHQNHHLKTRCLSKVLRIAKKYHLPTRSFLPKKRSEIKRWRIKTPDNLIAWHPDNKSSLFSCLFSSSFPVNELICHPGYYDKNSKYLYNFSREKELKVLKSAEFKKVIKNFKLISYLEI